MKALKIQQNINIKLDKEIHKRLKAIAAMEGSTMQEVSEKVITDYVKRRWKKEMEG